MSQASAPPFLSDTVFDDFPEFDAMYSEVIGGPPQDIIASYFKDGESIRDQEFSKIGALLGKEAPELGLSRQSEVLHPKAADFVE
jgi:hypothetical protein